MAFFVPLLIFFMILPGWLFLFLIHARRSVTCMAGMMSAMAIGMTIGLGTGTFVAVSLQIDSFYSTIIGMLIGCLAGAIAGIPISLMAVMDGMLSGLMAGMMGAMLGSMISPEFHILLLKILGILSGGTLFMLHLMLLSELRQGSASKLPVWLRKPSWIFSVILMSGIGLHAIQSESYTQDLPKQTEHSDHGTHEIIPKALPFAKQVRIQATEFAYSPSSVRMNVNETVEFILQNTGKVEHDFEIAETNVHIHSQPGKESMGTVRFSEPGTYLAVCTVPGHLESGMALRIVVT